MKLEPVIILTAVGLALLCLATLDIARHRRLTPAAKARLLAAMILLVVGALLAARA